MTERTARDRALGWLARREYAREELAARLRRSGYSSEDVERTLSELADAGLQSDDRYAESRIRARFNQGYGPIRIRLELQRFEVDESIIRRHLGSDEFDWFLSARKVLLKKYPRPPGEWKDKARRLRYLASRGFDAEQTEHAMDGYQPE
ncbi:MAG: regulatory protein RecX [Xanthomonadales bacterium]|nr:regulatory protein RecX [Xanthomonadales bacterium]